MEKRLDFDRGVIMLANQKKTRLQFVAGYGYSETHDKLLSENEFHLDKPDSKGVMVSVFKKRNQYGYKPRLLVGYFEQDTWLLMLVLFKLNR